MAQTGSGGMGNGSRDRGKWSSRWGFILAASGSAVGLGNIWKFPYITGENGGGLFVLIYLVCIALVGVPIMMAEIMIGRSAQRQPVAAFHFLQGGRSSWSAVGWMGVIGGFVILSYYVVVAGWAADYTLRSVINFVKPIKDSAVTEAKIYRVQTPLEDMREKLVKLDAERQWRDEVALLRRELPKFVWDVHARYLAASDAVLLLEASRVPTPNGEPRTELLAALGRMQGADTDWEKNLARDELTSSEWLREPIQKAREVLFEDEELAAAVAAVEIIGQKIRTVQRATLDRVSKEYSNKNRSDRQIRDQAEQEYRRELIAAEVGSRFDGLASDGWTSSFWSLVLMIVTIVIVAGGISGGIERTCKILMPLLILLICSMVVYGAFQPGFGSALKFVFYPDPSKLKASGVLEALGHAFFTLSLGMGAMITYGSYQKSKEGLAGQSVLIAGIDTVIALLACMMIFPIIFSYNQPAASGPGLVFTSMPLAFAEIGRGGMLLAIVFFGLLVFAALTSMISLLEVSCSYFIDERQWSRRRAATVIGAGVFVFSIPSAFSMSPGMLMTSWEAGYDKNFFDTMDYLASNWMLPLGGLLISVYAGWVMPKRMRNAELIGLSPLLVMGWLILVRFVAPVLVVLVLCQKVGILRVDELLY